MGSGETGAVIVLRLSGSEGDSGVMGCARLQEGQTGPSHGGAVVGMAMDAMVAMLEAYV